MTENENETLDVNQEELLNEDEQSEAPSAGAEATVENAEGSEETPETPAVEETAVDAPAVEEPVAETTEEASPVAEEATPAAEEHSEAVAPVEVPVAEEVAEETPKEEVLPDTSNAAAAVAAYNEEEDDDDFDWEEAESGYSKEERARLEALYEGTLTEVNEGEIVPGTVVSVGDKEVILNIGFKSEGIVQATEFRDLPDLKPGDQVDVYLESVEDQDGQLILSRRRAKHVQTWNRILRAENEDIILEGYIKRRTKGGFVVDIDGIEAFLPGSQIDVKPVRDFDAYVGKTMDFKVVKINHPFENVVISHKVLIEKDLEEQRQEILKNLEKGQILEGTVKNMTHFGVFIDLGGVDGLLHITDISWGRINHPEEVLELDQKVNIVVLEFDDEKKRISLGMKQLQPHPWDSLPEEIQQGSKVQGRVVTVAEYGIFVEIMPGVEGLVHMSEMSWSQHLKNPTELFKIGDEVEATVLSIDRDDRKMSLGLKQSKEDPWLNAAEKYAVSSRHTGIVRNMTNYGLFVELEEGVDGLVHISDLSWTKKYNHPSDFIKREENLEVVVLDIDVDNRRLSLGHKQLTEDVWITFESIFVVGSTHRGTVLSMNDKGAVVELEYGVEGFVPSKHLIIQDGKNKVKGGKEYDFKVIEFNKDAKKLVLSHRMTWDDTMRDEQRDRRRGKGKKRSSDRGGGGGTTNIPAAKTETTTLGEISALAQLKKQLEDQERAAAEKKLAEKGYTKTKDSEAPEAEAPSNEEE
ncbi:MAG: 30S ribosomal protein S1 [Bacteroidota bacterium]